MKTLYFIFLCVLNTFKDNIFPSCKFALVFTYTKQRDGNYTFYGFGSVLIRDAQNAMGIRYNLSLVPRFYIQFNIIFFRYKYIFIDEAEVKKKYGFIRTSLNYLDIKVKKENLIIIDSTL